jgi:hypothetical protein
MNIQKYKTQNAHSLFQMRKYSNFILTQETQKKKEWNKIIPTSSGTLDLYIFLAFFSNRGINSQELNTSFQFFSFKLIQTEHGIRKSLSTLYSKTIRSQNTINPNTIFFTVSQIYSDTKWG